MTGPLQTILRKGSFIERKIRGGERKRTETRKRHWVHLRLRLRRGRYYYPEKL